jgi:hypothetical protein
MHHPINFKGIIDGLITGFGLGFLEVVVLIDLSIACEDALRFELLNFGLLEIEGLLH